MTDHNISKRPDDLIREIKTLIEQGRNLLDEDKPS